MQNKWMNKQENGNSNNNSTVECNRNILQLMSNYRHDWLNHMQVILGYVSLNKADQIPQYIAKVNEGAKQRSFIANLKQQHLAIFLYMLPVYYPKLKIELEFDPHVVQHLEQIDEDRLTQTIKAFIDLFHMGINNDIEPPTLFLSFIGGEDQLILTFEFEGNVQPYINQIHMLGAQFDQYGDFLIDIYNENEFIMELLFH